MEENNQISFPNGMISNKVRGNDASDMLMYFNVSSAFKEYISRSGWAKSYVNSAAGLDQSGFARDQASTALGFFRYLGVNPETRRYVLPLSIVRRDSAGKMLESITFVTNPSEMTRSVSHASDAAMTRSSHVVTISGRNQTRISLRGKSPAFYGAEGLSCERMLLEGGIITSRDMSAGFLHMRMLQDIIRRDGITGLDHVDLGTGVAYDSFAATMRNRVIPLALDDFGLAYDGVEYNGSFASFSIDESAESPYIIDYNIEFVVSSIGGIGFAGHRDLDPKGGRKVFTANQDDIVDAQTLSFAGLKVPVPVGEYAKAMALAQANAKLEDTLENISFAVKGDALSKPSVKAILDKIKDHSIISLGFEAQHYINLSTPTGILDTVGTLEYAMSVYRQYPDLMANMYKTALDNAVTLYKDFKDVFDTYSAKSGVPVSFALITASRESGGGLSQRSNAISGKYHPNIFGRGSTGKEKFYTNVPVQVATYFQTAGVTTYRPQFLLYQEAIKSGYSPEEAILLYGLLLNATPSGTGKINGTTYVSTSGLYVYMGSNFKKPAPEASYVPDGVTGTNLMWSVAYPSMLTYLKNAGVP